MGHGYVRNRFGCNCFYGDSSFKRYNRAHGDTLIFNYNWGNNGYHCCGGSNKTGFWGGLGLGAGLGIGTGLMNMLGGWLGMGNGGFSMNGLFGGMSFPWGGSTGGGWWGGNAGWGNGNNSRTTSTNTTNTNTTTDSTTPTRSRQADETDDQKLDIDNPKISDFIAEINNLKLNPTKEKIEDLKARIEAAKEDTDGIQKTPDTKSYNGLLKMLEDIEKGLNTPKPEPKVETPTPKEELTKPKVENPNPNPTVGEGEVKIGKTIIKIDDLTVDNLKKVTEPEELANIDENKAKDILTKLGYIDNNGTGKLSNIYGVLLLLEKSKVTVEVEHRENAGKTDAWIKGPISNVTNNNNKISYQVDCKDIPGAAYGAKYEFTATDNTNTKFKCKIINNNNHPNLKVADIELLYQDEKKPILNKSGNPLVTNK